MNGLSAGQIRLVNIHSIDGPQSQSQWPIAITTSPEDVFLLSPEDAALSGVNASSSLHSRLHPPPQYIALSYTWGNERVPFGIQRDRKLDELDVSPNCLRALVQINHHFPGLPVWTDTLSIDHGNVPEKSHQIGLMGRIYKSAWKVAVWLGDEDNTGTRDLWSELELLTTPSPSETIGGTEDEQSARRQNWLRRLSQLHWFYRAWTFQEIRLASNAVALLGSKAVPWSDFIHRIQKVRKLEPQMSTVILRSQPAAFHRFSYIPQDRFFATLDELNSGTSTDLAGLLFLTWYRDATERVDKVYAVLSSHLLAPKEHGIKVDYNISWSQLCIKAARAAINNGGNLKVLKMAGMTARWKDSMTHTWNVHEFRELLSQPSWAPDWWRPPVQTRSHDSLLFDRRGCFEKLNFCCPTDLPKLDVDDASPLLVLTGVLLGIFEIDNPPGSACVHAPPICANVIGPAVVNAEDENVFIPQAPIAHTVQAIDKHLLGKCHCHTSRHMRSTTNFPASPPHSKLGRAPQLHFGHEKFHLTTINMPAEKKTADWPAQVLAKSVESGDWLVLLQGGGMPFILRPAKDNTNRIVTVREMQIFAQPSHSLPPDAGCFVLVGEASLCWDQIWPGRWSRYCRLGTFVIV